MGGVLRCISVIYKILKNGTAFPMRDKLYVRLKIIYIKGVNCKPLILLRNGGNAVDKTLRLPESKDEILF